MQKIWGSGLEDITEEFLKLRQDGTLDEYQDKFENLRIRMDRVLLELGESYFLSRFTCGLKDDIRPMVRILRPTSLSHG